MKFLKFYDYFDMMWLLLLSERVRNYTKLLSLLHLVNEHLSDHNIYDDNFGFEKIERSHS